MWFIGYITCACPAVSALHVILEIFKRRIEIVGHPYLPLAVSKERPKAIDALPSAFFRFNGKRNNRFSHRNIGRKLYVNMAIIRDHNFFSR